MVNREVRPDRGKENGEEVPFAAAQPSRENHGGGEDGNSCPPSEYLVPVKQHALASEDECTNRGQAKHIESPCQRPPGEHPLAILPVLPCTDHHEPERDRDLQQHCSQFGTGCGKVTNMLTGVLALNLDA